MSQAGVSAALEGCRVQALYTYRQRWRGDRYGQEDSSCSASCTQQRVINGERNDQRNADRLNRWDKWVHISAYILGNSVTRCWQQRFLTGLLLNTCWLVAATPCLRSLYRVGL
jgi:hypothetical protein